MATMIICTLLGFVLPPTPSSFHTVIQSGQYRAQLLMDQPSNHEQASLDVIGAIVRDEMSSLSALSPEQQDASLPNLLARVEERAASEAAVAQDESSSYQFGDITRAAVEATRGEVQRQLEADWNMNDLSLLLKIGIFLGASATAPVSGLAALPVAALLATYGTVLKAELGVRAIQEVGARLAERAAQGVADSMRSYTGKEEYSFGDLTEATVHRVTGEDSYRFGDLTRGALNKAGEALTGDPEYRFGSLTEKAVKAASGNDDYQFGDFTKSVFKRMSGKHDDQSDDRDKNKKQRKKGR